MKLAIQAHQIQLQISNRDKKMKKDCLQIFQNQLLDTKVQMIRRIQPSFMIFTLIFIVLMTCRPISCCSSGYDGCSLCANSSYCWFCYPGYYQGPGYCLPCISSCVSCPSSTNVCQTCLDRYGLMANGTTLCEPCSDNRCLDCNQNSTICVQCSNTYYGVQNDACVLCKDVNCFECYYDAFNCTNCQGPYGVSAGNCTFCVDPNCNNCTLNASSCAVCDNYYELQPNLFICSYSGMFQMQLVSLVRDNEYQNCFVMVVRIVPYTTILSEASQSDIESLFRIANQNIKIETINYNNNESQITIEAKFTSDFSTNQIIIDYKPESINNSYFFASVNQSIIVVVDGKIQIIQYYSDQDKVIGQLINYTSYAISAFACISALLGILVLKKLAGLEALLVVQFSWLNILWMPSPLPLPFTETRPLKYSSGFNRVFVTQVTIKSPGQQPHLFHFGMSQFFINNFNFSFLVQAIAIVIVIIAYIIVKDNKNKTQNQRQKICETNKQTEAMNEQNFKIMKVQQKIIEDQNQLQLAYNKTEHFFVFSFVFNFTYFVACVALFFQTGQKMNIPSLVFLVLVGLIFIIQYIKYILNPHFSEFFRYSFKETSKLAMQHYSLIILLTISSVGLQVLSSFPFLPAIPCAVMALYTIIGRPYKICKQNIRSIINLFTMLCFIGLKCFMAYSPRSQQYSLLAYSLLLACVCLLGFITVLALILMLYDYYYYDYLTSQCQLQNRQLEQSLQNQVLKQITRNKVRKEINQLKNSSKIKQLLPKHRTIIQMSSILKEKQKQKQKQKQGQKQKQKQPGRGIINESNYVMNTLMEEQDQMQFKQAQQLQIQADKISLHEQGSKFVKANLKNDNPVYSYAKYHQQLSWDGKIQRQNMGEKLKQKNKSRKQDTKQKNNAEEQVVQSILISENDYLKFKASIEFIQENAIIKNKIENMSLCQKEQHKSKQQRAKQYEKAFENIQKVQIVQKNHQNININTNININKIKNKEQQNLQKQENKLYQLRNDCSNMKKNGRYQ